MNRNNFYSLKFGVFALFSVFFCFAGCTTVYNPVTKTEEKTFYSEADEIKLGQAIDRKIQRQYKFLPEDRVYPGFSRLGEKLALASDRPNLNYTFQIITNKEVNAFSLPGGYVYITTGLLKSIETADELACVLGHEIGHIAARDSVNRLQKELLFSIPADILFSQSKNTTLQKVVDTSFNLAMLKYSREEELRADSLGVIYAYRASYDPVAMITFLEKLDKENPTSFLVFLKDHPNVPERIKNIQETISRLKEQKSNF